MAPDFELMLAAIQKLRATAAVTNLVGSKIYDRVPEDQTGAPLVASPYISCDYTDSAPDDAECILGEEILLQFDAWSWGAGEAYSSVQVRNIAWAVRQALHDAELTLTTNALVTLNHDRTRVQRASDGITNHAAIRFVGLVEIPN